MVRNLIAGLGTLGLFFMLTGCCEDKECPVSDATVDLLIDAKVPLQEGGTDGVVPEEAGPDKDAKADTVEPVDCEAMDISGTVTISQLVSDVVGGSGYLFSFGPVFEDLNNTTLNAPDYIDKPIPPNCTAYTWSAGGYKKSSTEDAGDVTITGHEIVQYDDGSGTLQDLPSTITCKREKAGTTNIYTYNCGLGSVPMLEGPAIVDNSLIDFATTGGECIPALSNDDLPAGKETIPDPTFDLNNIDPGAGITAKWSGGDTIGAVSISIWDKDETTFATLTCSALLAKTISFPSESLALVPTPTASNPINIRTSLLSFTPAGKVDTWGQYKVGVGRGHFGATCFTTSGPTPGPCP